MLGVSRSLSVIVAIGLSMFSAATASSSLSQEVCIMKTSRPGHNTDNVVDIFSGQTLSELHDQRFIRLAPELDGLEMLYSNDSHSEKLFSLKILRSEEHTSELQSRGHLVCRLLLEKKTPDSKLTR